MRRIRIEKTPAVCAQHFDSFLGSNGSLCDHLLRALDRFRDRVGMQVLNDALRAKEQRGNEGDRQKDVDRRAGQIDPKVPQAVHLLACEAANQCNRHGDAGCGGREILYR